MDVNTYIHNVDDSRSNMVVDDRSTDDKEDDEWVKRDLYLMMFWVGMVVEMVAVLVLLRLRLLRSLPLLLVVEEVVFARPSIKIPVLLGVFSLITTRLEQRQMLHSW